MTIITFKIIPNHLKASHMKTLFDEHLSVCSVCLWLSTMSELFLIVSFKIQNIIFIQLQTPRATEEELYQVKNLLNIMMIYDSLDFFPINISILLNKFS